MQILFWNIGYARQLDGSIKEYFKNGRQILYSTKKQQVEQLDEIVKVVKNCNPDVFLYAEVCSGSFRNQSFDQHKYLAEKIGCLHDAADAKYGSVRLRRAIFHKGNMNGVCALLPATIENIHLNHGGKTLIQKTTIGEFIVFSVHLSLVHGIRKKQLHHISELVQSVPAGQDVIVCGDFNILRGEDELNELRNATGLKIVTDMGYTFPAHKPTKRLDQVLYRVSPDRKVSARVLSSQLSDHLPVVLEVK